MARVSCPSALSFILKSAAFVRDGRSYLASGKKRKILLGMQRADVAIVDSADDRD